MQTPIDDEWRRWMAESLLLGISPETLVDEVAANGVDRAMAEAELQAAQASPYVRGAQRLANRLRKRDWQLATYAKLWRMHPAATQVERRHRLSSEEFFTEYYSRNRPVIITGMMDDWPAMQKWSSSYLESRVGDAVVEIQFGRTGRKDYEIDRERLIKKIPFRAFLNMIHQSGSTNNFYCTANNTSSNRKALAPLWDDIVQIPEYLNGNSSADGFFWMGPRGTVTPFHHDLTNNFMAQVRGRKLVKFVPSYETPLMRNEFHCYSEWDGRQLDDHGRGFDHVPRTVDCVLEPGEILFLPIGWWHYVEGLDVTITISFINFKWDNDFYSFYKTYHEV